MMINNTAAVSLVELVGEIPPIIKVLLPCAALAVFVENKDRPSWSEYQPSVLASIQEMSNCCPGSMSHVWNRVAFLHTLTML